MSATLREQQTAFARALRNGESPNPALLQTGGSGGAARFGIYLHGYRVRMTEALQENYPVLASVLGDDAFAQLAADFLRDRPSNHASIRWFGAALADYVSENPASLPHPALHDLIRMEWALGTAFDSTDAIPLTFADMTKVAPEDWPSLRFAAHPSLRLLAMQWAVEPVWVALHDDPDADTGAPEQLAHVLLVWREEFVNKWRSLDEREAMLLQALLDGASFGELCELGSTRYPDDDNIAATLATHLRGWIDAGMLVSYP